MSEKVDDSVRNLGMNRGQTGEFHKSADDTAESLASLQTQSES